MKEIARIPELLAPAGGLAQLHAAVNNGADAVYLGGARFNARGKAENFTLPKLRDAIAYAHQRNVKIYVTFNTLLKDRELPDALEYAGALWDIGADAVIVQDMGLVRMLRTYLPDLPLHMSTQGTVTGKWAVDLMKDFGIRRIVPARELSLQEIREMAEACHGAEPVMPMDGPAPSGMEERSGAPSGMEERTGAPSGAGKQPPCELEVFVHGALCMCYSGQCQMSRLLGGGRADGSSGRADGGSRVNGRDARGKAGSNAREPKTTEKGSVRSGNRGLCAQPCRLPYTDDRGRTGYFLSPKDLCLLQEIPALCEAGVDSLKIEGRLKSPEYVAVVTGIYRKYLDEYARTGIVRVSQEDLRDLTQIYNRGGFTKGYLYGNPGEEILSGNSPKNTGIYIGRVCSVVDPGKAGSDRAAAAGAARKGAVLVDVELKEPLAEGDGVEFRPADETRITDAAGGVVTFRRELSGRALRIGDMKGRIFAGDGVYRVTDRGLLERARATFDTEDPADLDRRMRRRIPLQMKFEARTGEPARLQIREVCPSAEAGEHHCFSHEEDIASDRSGSERSAQEQRMPDRPTPERSAQEQRMPDRPTPERSAQEQRMPDRPTPATPEQSAPIRPEVMIQSAESMEPARNRAAEPDRIRQQLAKLGGTPFEASPENIEVILDGQCAVPVAQINQMRREGIDQILQQKRQVKRAPADTMILQEAGEKLAADHLTAPMQIETELIPLMEFMEGAAGLPYIDAVSKGRLDAYIQEHFGQIVARLQQTRSGILIRGNSWIRQFLDAGVRVYGGHGLNIYNQQARLAYEELGVTVAELSHETGDPGLAPEGRIPLMITEHEIQSKTLTDRKGRVHQIQRSPTGDKTLIW